MSRGIKTLWIVIACIFAVGIILATAGFALGATGSAWYDRQGLHFGSSEKLELSDSSTEPFENIDIKLLDANVEIIVANNYGYEFSYTGTRDPRVEVRNGTLTVVENKDNWRLNLFGWNWQNWVLFDASANLKVYVPRSATLNNVSLNMASGNTVFNGSQMSIKDLTCNSMSGNIKFTDLKLDQLTLDVASGDVELNNVSAIKANINMMSGWLHYSGAKLDSMTLNMTSGNLRLDGEITKLLQLRMISGDSTIVLAGNKDDYSFELNKISGSVKVDGQRIDWGFDGPGSHTIPSSTGRGGHISIDTTSGDVDISFKN